MMETLFIDSQPTATPKLKVDMLMRRTMEKASTTNLKSNINGVTRHHRESFCLLSLQHSFASWGQIFISRRVFRHLDA